MNRHKACWGLLLGAGFLSFGQATNVLWETPTPLVKLKVGTVADVRLPLQLSPGYHTNSNAPSDPYLIPLKLTWGSGPLEPVAVFYPRPQLQKVSFSEKPVSVFSGRFDLVTRFKIPPSATPGPTALIGSVRYQACTDNLCLPPKTIDVALEVDISQ